MTYKQIETSREIRLWLTSIIVPAVTTVGTLMMVPEVRYAVKSKVNNVRLKLKKK